MTDSTSWTADLRTPAQHGPNVQNLQDGQTSAPVPRGHTFGNTIVQGQASAHFGDSYTSYHIYKRSDRAEPEEKRSLTIGDALTGILASSARVTSLVSTFSNPSPTLREVQGELIGLGTILSSLQSFINDSSSAIPGRAGLIELENIVTVMTQLVLLYSEFEALIDYNDREKPRQWSLAFSRLGKGAAASRLLNNLQRHKSTLSIILQILQWFVPNPRIPCVC
jgi:hypothetical protein